MLHRIIDDTTRNSSYCTVTNNAARNSSYPPDDLQFHAMSEQCRTNTDRGDSQSQRILQHICFGPAKYSGDGHVPSGLPVRQQAGFNLLFKWDSLSRSTLVDQVCNSLTFCRLDTDVRAIA